MSTNISVKTPCLTISVLFSGVTQNGNIHKGMCVYGGRGAGGQHGDAVEVQESTCNT